MRNLLRGREAVQNTLIFRYIVTNYAPQNHAIFASLPHLLTTIPLSPTDS
ncbi:MAG: hypothetical protein BMS9Abin18_1382 [Zetaproteobacteria bacterium]|nr:MAG: hypothetical protein BMS9Abin18_1382 [Zetaproteobacteria bacterium]